MTDPPQTRADSGSALDVVLLVTSEHFWGIERHVFALASALRTRGVECVIACPPTAERLRREAAAAGVPVLPRSTIGGRWWLLRALRSLASDPPSILHTHDGVGSLAAWPLTPRATRLVRTQHFVRPRFSTRSGAGRTAARALHRKANSRLSAYVAVSTAVADAALERGEVDESRVHVIAPGIPLPEADAAGAARRRRAAAASPTVVCVGRLEREKGVRFLLEAAPLVLDRIPHCRFVIVGSGDEQQALAAYADRLGIAGACVWTGEVDDATTIIRDATVLVNPTPAEGFGIVVAEAMSWGVPVVASRTGAAGSLLLEAGCGIAVEPSDTPALAEAIVRLATTPDLAAELGLNGQLYAGRLLGADRTAEQMHALYDAVVADAACRRSASA